MSEQNETTSSWHKNAIVYQIYPRSFMDSNADGIGDLQGIIDKLDYLAGSQDSLGVTAIWLSPIFTSPMADFGYDVSNYTGIDPIFGDIEIFRNLVTAAHSRSIRVILDFVPNHSSDQHPWFVESSASLDNPKRDWYVWRSPNSDGTEPNNWVSVFGGSAWQLSEKTGQYYLHSFLAEQPDLNWDNLEVRAAMKDAMRFWLELGVDGFRVDAVDWLSKDLEFRDDPEVVMADNSQERRFIRKYSRDGPALYARLEEMTQVLAEYDDRFMITEAHPETANKVAGYLKYYQSVNPIYCAPFNFEGIYLPWQAASYKTFVDEFQAGMQPTYTPIYTVGNHDESRVATRIGPAAARVAAMLQLTLPGMPILYYGDELGMTDVVVPPAQLRDPFRGPGNGRDGERTPMQWDTSSNAGFSSGVPWLPISDNYIDVNVAAELQLEDSMLELYKRLIHYRINSQTLKTGSYIAADFTPDVFAYYRLHDNQKLLILLNYKDQEQLIESSAIQGTIVLSTHADGVKIVDGGTLLRANEGIVIDVQLND